MENRNDNNTLSSGNVEDTKREAPNQSTPQVSVDLSMQLRALLDRGECLVERRAKLQTQSASGRRTSRWLISLAKYDRVPQSRSSRHRGFFQGSRVDDRVRPFARRTAQLLRGYPRRCPRLPQQSDFVRVRQAGLPRQA